jgi:hypothetical protein
MKFSSSDMARSAAVFPYWKDVSLMCGSSAALSFSSTIFSAVPRYFHHTCLGLPSTLAISGGIPIDVTFDLLLSQ